MPQATLPSEPSCYTLVLEPSPRVLVCAFFSPSIAGRPNECTLAGLDISSKALRNKCIIQRDLRKVTLWIRSWSWYRRQHACQHMGIDTGSSWEMFKDPWPPTFNGALENYYTGTALSGMVAPDDYHNHSLRKGSLLSKAKCSLPKEMNAFLPPTSKQLSALHS